MFFSAVLKPTIKVKNIFYFNLENRITYKVNKEAGKQINKKSE